MPATTSRPGQLDCIIHGYIPFYILSLATLAIVPTKVCPSLPDVYARLEWLAVLSYGCHYLAFIPVTIYLDRNRTPMGFSDILTSIWCG